MRLQFKRYRGGVALSTLITKKSSTPLKNTTKVFTDSTMGKNRSMTLSNRSFFQFIQKNGLKIFIRFEKIVKQPDKLQMKLSNDIGLESYLKLELRYLKQRKK